MRKYNLSNLFRKAWSLFRQAAKKAAMTFGAALRLAWAWLKAEIANASKIDDAAKAAGIVSEFHSWAGWKALGREVIHEQQAAFKVEVSDPTTKNGKRVKSFFTVDQTAPIPA